MSMRFLPAAWNGGRVLSLPALCCLALALTACAGASGGGGKAAREAVPDVGSVTPLAYGISIQVPDDWQTNNSVGPGAVSKTALEAQIKTQPATPILTISRPTGQGQAIDARVTLFVADSAKYFPPEQEVSTRSPEELDMRAKAFMRQRNEAAVKQNKPPDTLESRMTRETVDGRLALFHRGIGAGPDGQLHFQVWHIYLPNGVGIGVDAIGSADSPGMDRLLESIVRSLRFQDGVR